MLTCGAWSCLQNGWTATMHAAENGHVEVVDRLLAAGADKDAQDRVVRVTSGGRYIKCRGVCVRDEGQVGVCEHLVSVRGYGCMGAHARR